MTFSLRRVTYTIIFICVSNAVLCQKKENSKKLKLYCKISNPVLNNVLDLPVQISVICLTKKATIEMPIYFGRDGEINFEIYKVTKKKRFVKLPSNIIVDYNPYQVRYTKTLSQGDSINLNFSLGFFNKGSYKFRGVLKDMNKRGKNLTFSNWTYFTVLNEYSTR